MEPAENPPKPPASPAAELPSYGLEEDAPTGWRRWLRGPRLVILILLLLALTAAAFGIRPLYREVKARRALAIAGEAGAAIDRGDMPQASTLLRQAALMAFSDERVAALVTFHAARSGDMASVAELGKRLDAGEASAEESLVFGERSLGAGRLPDAERALQALPAELPTDQAVRRSALEAGVAQGRGDGTAAAAALRAAIERFPGSESDGLRIMLAQLLASTEDPSAGTEAGQLLEQAAAGQGRDAANALRLIAASKAGLGEANVAAVRAAADRLRAHPSGEPGDEILIARLVMASDPASRTAAIDEMAKRLQERGADIDTRAAAARWLVGIGENEAVLQLVGPEEPSAHAGALMVMLDALSGLERWDECSALLEANRGGTLPDTLYHLFRARIAGSRGTPEEEAKERRQLRQVMQFAELPHVLFAARYAESVGWKPEAFAAWRIISSDEGARLEALRAQLRNFPETASAAEGADIAGQLLELAPEDPSARLSAAFYRLLAGQDTTAAAATAEEFLAADPESADVRRVAALGRLRTGRAAEGLDILPEDNGEPRWRVLHAALLRAAGQPAEAEKITAGVNLESLTPEEREMLQAAGSRPGP
jgi:hypothetical protein